MIHLHEFENQADLGVIGQYNFEAIEARLWFSLPSVQTGAYTTIIGPPTTGDWTVNALWWDVNRAQFRCTVASDPGPMEWIQTVEPVVGALPAEGVPDGYRALLSTTGVRYRYDLAEDEWVAISAINGTVNSCVSFDRGDSIDSGEYVGGRHRWAVDVVLKSASVIVGSAGVGATTEIELEINGDLTGHVLSLAGAATGGELALPDVAVPAGQYVRWKVVASPASIDDCPAQVNISLNLNS